VAGTTAAIMASSPDTGTVPWSGSGSPRAV